MTDDAERDDAQRLDEIRELTQNIIDGWQNTLPRDVYFALERIIELATEAERYE